MTATSPHWAAPARTAECSTAETTWVEPYRIPAARNIEDLNGILGNRFLMMFRVFFDYNGGRLILEKPRQITAILPPITSSSD